MKQRRLAIIGWGRLGRACADVIHEAPDLLLAGVVRRAESLGTPPPSTGATPFVGHVRELQAVDVALVCVPSQAAAGIAHELLQERMPIVECAALDGAAAQRHHEALAHAAARHRTAAVVGAGWDPDLLPQLRRVFELLIPHGRSSVSLHVAAGAHHTAAAAGVPGVQDALCSEVHDADGTMRRYVYVQLAAGADLQRVREQVESDPVFAQVPTQVLEVADLTAFERGTEGVLVERLGEGAQGPHASLVLEARLNVTQFSARLMIDAARMLVPGMRGGCRYTPFGLVPLP